MAIRLAVGPQTLNLVAQVRILDRQPESAPSSSGLGHHPLKVEITGSNPVCATRKLKLKRPVILNYGSFLFLLILKYIYYQRYHLKCTPYQQSGKKNFFPSTFRLNHLFHTSPQLKKKRNLMFRFFYYDRYKYLLTSCLSLGCFNCGFCFISICLSSISCLLCFFCFLIGRI